MELRFETDDPCGLARKLLAEGHAHRLDRLVTMRGEMRCLSGPVGWFADRTVRENARESPFFTKWRPFPDVRRRQGTASDGLEVE
jgi:hypothetical protein